MRKCMEYLLFFIAVMVALAWAIAGAIAGASLTDRERIRQRLVRHSTGNRKAGTRPQAPLRNRGRSDDRRNREMNRGGGNPAAFILMAALLFAAALWTLLAVAKSPTATERCCRRRSRAGPLWPTLATTPDVPACAGRHPCSRRG